MTLLPARCDEAGLCLGQYETDRKVNEPRVLPDLLALKRRQLLLYAATPTAFARAPDAECGEAPAEKPRHARHATRRCRALPASVLPESLRAPWPQLRAVMQVQSTRTPTRPMPQVRTAADPVVQTCFRLTSLAAPAATLLGLVRRLWGIENRLHWVLDVVSGEDQSRKRAGRMAANYAAVRKLVLRLLQQLPEKISFQRRRNQCALDDDYRHRCLQV